MQARYKIKETSQVHQRGLQLIIKQFVITGCSILLYASLLMWGVAIHFIIMTLYITESLISATSG